MKTYVRQSTYKEERFLVMNSFRVFIPSLWACGKAEHHGGVNMEEQRYSPHSDQEAIKDDNYNNVPLSKPINL
jgi:hypothetical protein